jgi:hypothetical protein
MYDGSRFFEGEKLFVAIEVEDSPYLRQGVSTSDPHALVP